MPRRRPKGWPRYMDDHRRRAARPAYYWKLPSWAKRAGCPMRSEALGNDYGEAKRRCDDILNPLLDAWRTRDEAPSPDREAAARHVRLDGRSSTGHRPSSPSHGQNAEELRRRAEARLGLRPEGRAQVREPARSTASRPVPRTAVREAEGSRPTVRSGPARRSSRWRSASGPGTSRGATSRNHVPLANPFAKMGLTYTAKPTRPVTYDGVDAVRGRRPTRPARLRLAPPR